MVFYLKKFKPYWLDKVCNLFIFDELISSQWDDFDFLIFSGLDGRAYDFHKCKCK